MRDGCKTSAERSYFLINCLNIFQPSRSDLAKKQAAPGGSTTKISVRDETGGGEPPAALSVLAAGRFEEEPGAPLGLVDPDFKQARGCDIAIFFADIVGLAHDRGELFVVVTQFGQHVLRLDIDGIIVEDALLLGDLPYRAQRRAANFARPFRDRVRHRKNLVPVLIEQQMIVPEMMAAHMPMKIL